MTSSPSTVQISAGLLAMLFALLSPPRRLTVAELRRQAACRGIKGFHRQGRRLPVKYASRRELLQLLTAADAADA
jgi:hypothetical protein